MEKYNILYHHSLDHQKAEKQKCQRQILHLILVHRLLQMHPKIKNNPFNFNSLKF